jgi:hypothetical protein
MIVVLFSPKGLITLIPGAEGELHE